MAIRHNGVLVNRLRNNGTELNAVYYNGTQIWQPGGVPAISAFTVTPDKLLESAPGNIVLAFAHYLSLIHI